VNILKKRYEGSSVTKVTVTEDSVCAGIYSADRSSVCVRVTGGKPNVSAVSNQYGVPDKFLDRLNGGTITCISGRKYDRVFYFDIEKRRPSGKMETHRLVFELIGKMSNAMLLNESGMIIWMFCKNNADADRQTGLGQMYQMPKSNKEQTLEKYSDENFSSLLGFYPPTVIQAEKYTENGYSFAETAVLIKESLFEDENFYADSKGRIIPFRPFEYSGEIFSLEDLAGIDGQKPAVTRDVSIKNRLVRYFEKQGEKYLKLKDKLEIELSEAEKFGEYQEKGDLLKSNIHILKNASGEAELSRYSEQGVEKVIFEIPENFDVKKEINRLYKKSEKLKRSVPQLAKRIAEVDNIAESVLEQLYFIEISADDDELRELALEMKKKAPKQQKRQIKEKQFEKIDIGGGTAYIGKNSVSNHRLVFQFAQPSDWWFHAQKIPSAHLIFRKDGNINDQEVKMCADIVAAYSKAKNDLRVTVDYTQKKHVKKPKNTPPGFVVYNRFFSVTGEPENVKMIINGDTNGQN